MTNIELTARLVALKNSLEKLGVPIRREFIRQYALGLGHVDTATISNVFEAPYFLREGYIYIGGAAPGQICRHTLTEEDLAKILEAAQVAFTKWKLSQ